MRNETVTYKIFKFEELNKEVQEKVLTDFRLTAFDEIEVQDLTEVFQETLRILGLPNDDVRWSLSCRQGDGVAFYGKLDIVNLMELNFDEFFPDIEQFKSQLEEIKKQLTLLGDDTEIEIEKSRSFHLYDHFNTMIISGNHYNEAGDTFNSLLGGVEELVKDVSKYLERLGYKHIDFIQSDEYIKEIIHGNDYEFLEDGSISQF